jgi:hypothetical protein
MGAVPSVSPSVFATPLPVAPPDPYWSGFGAGVWITLGIVAALIIVFLIGRYAQFPARVQKKPAGYEHAEGKRR